MKMHFHTTYKFATPKNLFHTCKNVNTQIDNEHAAPHQTKELEADKSTCLAFLPFSAKHNIQ